MAFVHGPGLIAVQKCGEDYGLVPADLSLLGDAAPIPDILLESTKGSTLLG